MKFKKILTVTLAAAMGISAVAGIVACGDDGGGTTSSGSGKALPAYTGETLDGDGKMLFNDDIFYRNDKKGIAADPFLLDDTQEGRSGYYYAYSTLGLNFVYRSKDLAHWEAVRHTLDISDDDVKSVWTDIWAPEVIYDEDAEKYFMFFSATPQSGNGAQYLMYLATSDSPEGPFKLVDFTDKRSCDGNTHDYDSAVYSAEFAKHLLFDPEDFGAAASALGYGKFVGGSVAGTGYLQTIDPHPFVDPVADGSGKHKKYLYFVGNASSNVNFVVEMENWYKPKWNTLKDVMHYGYYTVADYNRAKNGEKDVPTVPYETSDINEGPTVYYNADNGKYYLTYSTGNYKNASYQVCQAVADRPDGDFRKLTTDENGCFLSGGTQGSNEVSGTGHHSLVTLNGKLYALYHRHDDFAAAGERRNAAIDEITWITVKDPDDNDLLAMYANGPTSTLQPRLLGSDYRNIASEATVSGGKLQSGSTLKSLTDGLLSSYITENAAIEANVKETYLTETSTIEFNFDTERTVRAVMVYNSKSVKDIFRNIKRIEILSNGENYVIENVKFSETFYEVSSYDGAVTYVSPCAAAFAEFDEIKASRISITVEVPSGQSRVGLSEVRILGK